MAYYIDYDLLIVFICGLTVGFMIGYAINSLFEYQKRLIKKKYAIKKENDNSNLLENQRK